MVKLFLMLGAVNAFLCVALGAFGAHGLKNRIESDLLAVYQTGVQYHIFHALALLVLGLAAAHLQQPGLVRIAGWAFIAGIVLFSGSLYALALTNVRVLGAITPLGGVAFLIGWALFAVAAYRGL